MSLEFFFNAQDSAIILQLSFYNNDLYDTLKSTFCVICVSWRQDVFVFISRKNVGNDMIGLLYHTLLKGKTTNNAKDRINKKCHHSNLKISIYNFIYVFNITYTQTRGCHMKIPNTCQFVILIWHDWVCSLFKDLIPFMYSLE